MPLLKPDEMRFQHLGKKDSRNGKKSAQGQQGSSKTQEDQAAQGQRLQPFLESVRFQSDEGLSARPALIRKENRMQSALIRGQNPNKFIKSSRLDEISLNLCKENKTQMTDKSDVESLILEQEQYDRLFSENPDRGFEDK